MKLHFPPPEILIFSPTLLSSTKYDIYFRNSLFNPHSGHNATAGGIVSSTGFKIEGDTTNIWYLDDDGAGNVRVYYLSGTTRIYTSTSFGTIDYSTGEIILTNFNITSISNIDGAIGSIASMRANLGAVSNRFDHIIDNLTNVVANTEAAKSRVEDADFAVETTQLTRNTVLQQAATSMVAQANAQKDTILALIQG